MNGTRRDRDATDASPTRSADPAPGRGAASPGDRASPVQRTSSVVRSPAAALDARLACGAVAGWIGVALCLSRSAHVALISAAISGLIALAALGLARRGARDAPRPPLGGWWRRPGRRGFLDSLRRPHRLLERATASGASVAGRAAAAVALMGFCVVLVLVPLAARLTRAGAGPLFALAREHAAVTLEVVVRDDPRALAATGVAGTPRVAVDTSAARLVMGQTVRAVSGDVLVLGPARGWADVLPGQRVRVSGSLQPSLDRPRLAVTLAGEQAPQLRGQPPWWQRAAGAVRADLRRAASGLPEQERGLLPGLIDGDTSGLDPVLREHFRSAGLTHLIAVSGTNCSILVGTAILLLRRTRARPWVCAVGGFLILLAFVVVARPSPSVLRAAVMALIALLALAAGRERQALPALSAAALVLLLVDPTLAIDAGFAMSVLATAALLTLAPKWSAGLRRRRVPAVLAEPVAVAAAAHVLTAPVIVTLSGSVSLVAIPANVLVEPVVAPATVVGFLAAATGPIFLPLARLLAQLAGWPCRWMVFVADRLGGLHGATITWPSGAAGALELTLALLIIGAAMRIRWLRPACVAAALVAVIVQFPVRSVVAGWPPPGWLLVACDVGQGDGLALSAGPHTAVVIDSGPDPVPMARCLDDLGVTHVPLLIFTHYHLDHVGGIRGVLRGRRVDRVISGPLAEPASGVALVRAALPASLLPVTTPPSGAVLTVAGTRLEVLGPAHPFHGTRSDPNNSSLVLRATVAGTRILLPGDAEIEAQQALLAAGVDVRADVLKVPHHGSAYSDQAFLAAVHARVAVISVGAHNDYGHPSPLLLQTMSRLGVPTRRTDRDGDVAIAGHGGALTAVARGTQASSAALAAAALAGDDDDAPDPAVEANSTRYDGVSAEAAGPRAEMRMSGQPGTRPSGVREHIRPERGLEAARSEVTRPMARPSRDGMSGQACVPSAQVFACRLPRGVARAPPQSGQGVHRCRPRLRGWRGGSTGGGDSGRRPTRPRRAVLSRGGR